MVTHPKLLEEYPELEKFVKKGRKKKLTQKTSKT
jgi:hypothetical protein